MADFTVSSDLDTFMQSADKPAMRTNMDLGTAATKDVAATGDAASGEVVKGDDTRLTDARTPVSHTHTASEVTDFDTEVANNSTVAANTSKLSGIEAGAEVNNISDTNATDLTDGGDSTLHYHSSDRNRANHTGTQTLSTISDAGTIASQDANSVTITGGSVTGITDLAIADGGTGASTASAARTNLEVYSDAEVDAKLATKAVAGGVELKGNATSISSTISSFGTGDFSIVFKANFSTNEQSQGVFSTFIGSSLANGITCFTGSSPAGQLLLRLYGSTTSDRRQAVINNFISTYGGQWRTFCFARSNDVLSIIVDGVSVPYTESTTGTAPSWNGEITNTDFYLGRSAVSVSDAMFADFRIFNRALSAAEVAELYESGTVAVEDRWVSEIEETFDSGISSAGKNDTDGSSTTLTHETSTPITGAGSLKVDITSPTSTNDTYPRININAFDSCKAGYRYRLNFDTSLISGSATLRAIRYGRGGSNYFLPITTLSLTGNQSWEYEVLVTDGSVSTPTAIDFQFDGTVAPGAFLIDNVKVTQLGCIADLPLDEGTGTKFYDRSPNNYNATGSDTGITHLLPIEPRDERERLGVTAQLNTKETAGGVELDGGFLTSSNFSISSQFTFYGQAKVSSTSNFNVISQWLGTGNQRSFSFGNSGGNFALFISSDGTNVANDALIFSSVPTDTLFSFCLTFDSGSAVLYIDGAQSATATGTITTPFSSTAQLEIGRSLGFALHNGLLRNLRIFNRALTATEVQELHDTNTVAVADRWGGKTGLMGSIATNSDVDLSTFTATGSATVSSQTATGFTGLSIPTPITTVINDAVDGLHADGANLVDSSNLIKLSFTISNFSGTGDVAVGFSGQSYPSTGAVLLGGNGDYVVYLDNTANNANARIKWVAVGGTADFDLSNFNAERAGCIADLPLDEGIGYQFHDRSSNHFDALASTSGVTHLVPKTEGYIRDFNVDAYNGGTGAFIVTSAQQMLPDNAMWSDLLIEDNIGGTNFSGSAFYVNDGITGSNVLIASPVGITGAGGKVLSVAPSNVAITPSRNRLFFKVTDSTPNPGSLNVRADYKQI